MFSSLSRHIRACLSAALVLMSFASVLVPATTAAAQTQSLTSQLTGVTVSYGPPYTLNGDPAFSEDTLETMVFVGSADILSIGFMSPLIELNAGRDIMLESLFGELGTSVTIDRGDYSGVSYSLDMLNFEGQEMGVFSLFMNQRSHGYAEFYIFIAPPALFGATMQTAQNSFTVDGNPIMNGVDSTTMGNMVTANTGITGGTAVTDVTDVTTENTDPAETPAPTKVTSSNGTSSDAMNYVSDLIGQRSEFLDSFAVVAENLALFTDEASTDAQKQTALQAITDEATYWSGFDDRAAGITAPAGYEDVHTAYLNWSNEITTLGNFWLNFIKNGASVEPFFDQIGVMETVDSDFAAILQDANTRASTSGEGTDTTETPAPTEDTTTTTTTSTDSADATAYLDDLTAQHTEFVESFQVVNEAMQTVVDETATDAEKQEAFQTITDNATIWSGYNDRAAGITAPAGYEDVHASYLTWSDEITTMGNNWIGFINQEHDSAPFFDQIPIAVAADEEFVTVLMDASSRSDTGGTTQTTTTDETPAATETTSTSSRTTRSTGSSETPEATEEVSTGSTSRTSRTTRSTGTSDETPEATETTTTGSTRTTRTTSNTTTTNTSETGGQRGSSNRTQTSSTESADNEWYMDQQDVTITWNNDFSLSEVSEEPQISDAEKQENRISLQYNGTAGVVRFTTTTFATNGGDATPLITNLSNDDDALKEIFGTEAEVVEIVVDEQASAMLIQTADQQGVYFVYVQTTCVTADCSTVSMVTMVGEGQAMVDAISATNDSVAIDGTSITDAIPVSTIEEHLLAAGSMVLERVA